MLITYQSSHRRLNCSQARWIRLTKWMWLAYDVAELSSALKWYRKILLSMYHRKADSKIICFNVMILVLQCLASICARCGSLFLFFHWIFNNRGLDLHYRMVICILATDHQILLSKKCQWIQFGSRCPQYGRIHDVHAIQYCLLF